MTSLIRRDWPDLPDMFRRFVESDADKGWLRTEEFVDGDSLVVRAELPGIDPEKDVDISVSGDVLRIRAQREEKSEEKNKDSYRSEFRYGSFTRNVPLPAGTTDADIQAAYRDGVLEIRVPVSGPGRPEPRRIPVTRS
jgi:HSP20 family protein